MTSDKTIKAKVICTFKHPVLFDMLPLNYETEIRSVLSDKDTVIVNEGKRFDPVKKEWHVWLPEVVRKRGSFIGMEIKTKNGEWISDNIITDFIGFYDINKVLQKI